MTNAVAPFDPDALKKRVAETVQSQFGMLIPPEQFDKMVADEVKAYFETETKFTVVEEEKRNSWDNHRSAYVTVATMTPFRRQCWEAVAALVKDVVKKHLESDVFKAQIDPVWNNESQANNMQADISILLQRKLDLIAPKMAAALFQQCFVEAVNQAKTEIQSELSRRIH